MAAALFAAAHILRLPKEGEVKPPKAIEDRTVRSYTSAEMLRSPKFYLLFLSLVCIAAIGNSFFSFLRDYAVSLGFSTATAAALVGLCSVCNGIGRVLCGLSFDRAGWRVVMPVVAILAIVSAALALLAVSAGLSWLAVITICLMGASFGCCPVISMSAISAFFGPKHYSENLGIQNFNLMGASFCASVSGLLITREGDFVSALYFLLGLGVAALLLIFVLKALKEEKIPPQNKRKDRRTSCPAVFFCAAVNRRSQMQAPLMKERRLFSMKCGYEVREEYHTSKCSMYSIKSRRECFGLQEGYSSSGTQISAPSGQFLTHAGIRPLSRRWAQPLHLAIFPPSL